MPRTLHDTSIYIPRSFHDLLLAYRDALCGTPISIPRRPLRPFSATAPPHRLGLAASFSFTKIGKKLEKPYFRLLIRLKKSIKRLQRAISALKTQKNKKSWAEICTNKKIISIFALAIGEMPEWSIGPHSKCGERATVPGVRIPLSPQRATSSCVASANS